LPSEGSSVEIFITLRGMIFYGIYKSNFGSASYEAYNATWDFGTNTPLSVGLRKTA